jgi:hypothetical protein
LEIAGFLIIGFLIIFLIYQQTRLIYNRCIRTYKKEIKEYLNNKKYEYIETQYPNEKDWSKGPFAKPSKSKLSFVLIHINGIFISWSNKDYLIIVGYLLLTNYNSISKKLKEKN